MRVWTRRLLVAGAAVGALAAGACGTDGAPGSEPSGDVSEIGVAGTSHCPGKPAAAPRPPRSWATEEVVLDGDTFVVRLPHDWSLVDEGDGPGDAYALVPDDASAVAVALAGGSAAVDVREVAEFATAVNAWTRRSPTSFAGGRGCRLSVDGEGGDDRYEVWLADHSGAIAAIAGGSADNAAAWREAEAIVASIEKVGA
jgi:hypothetical protein